MVYLEMLVSVHLCYDATLEAGLRMSWNIATHKLHTQLNRYVDNRVTSTAVIPPMITSGGGRPLERAIRGMNMSATDMLRITVSMKGRLMPNTNKTTDSMLHLCATIDYVRGVHNL